LKWWAGTKINSTFLICLKFLGSIQFSNCPTFFEHQDFQNAHECLGINETFFNFMWSPSYRAAQKSQNAQKFQALGFFQNAKKFGA
jgi:hypothetical protein